MPRTQSDWVELYNRLAEGDRLALLEVSRLVTDFLRRARATDFDADWEDFVQEVLITTVTAVREDRIRGIPPLSAASSARSRATSSTIGCGSS